MGVEWKDEHRLFRAALDLPPSFAPWTTPKDQPPPELKGVPRTSRYIDCLDLAWASRDVETRRRKAPWFCDYSQNISRKKFGSHIHTITQTSRIYDYQRDQLILPGEIMQLQGLPTPDMDTAGLDLRDMYSLAGQGFFCPSVSTMLMGVFLNPFSPWWPEVLSD